MVIQLNTLKNNIFIILLLIFSATISYKYYYANKINHIQTKRVERYADNLIRVKKYYVKSIKIKDEEIKHLIKHPKTEIKVVVKTTTNTIPVIIHSKDNYSGEDKFVSWQLKNKIFSYKLKPIKIKIYEGKNGFVVKAEKGIHIDSDINISIQGVNSFWAMIDTSTGISLIYENKRYLFSVRYNIISSSYAFCLGIRLLSF